jgi:hypothetical protein
MGARAVGSVLQTHVSRLDGPRESRWATAVESSRVGTLGRGTLTCGSEKLEAF